jgi:hypothetical protein
MDRHCSAIRPCQSKSTGRHRLDASMRAQYKAPLVDLYMGCLLHCVSKHLYYTRRLPLQNPDASAATAGAARRGKCITAK